MKKYFFILINLLFILLSGCNQDNKIFDTPSNVSTQLVHLLNYTGVESSESYNEFLELFHNQSKENISLDMYDQLKSISSNGASLMTTELIRYQNGQVLLVNFYSEPVNGEYKIVDIIVIPEDVGDVLSKYIN